MNLGRQYRFSMWLTGLLALLTLLPQGTRAQDDDAQVEALLAAGQEALEARRYQASLACFGAAYERTGRAELLYPIGISADRLHRGEQALSAYEELLEALPGHAHRAEVQDRVRTLRVVIDARAASRSEWESGHRAEPLAPNEGPRGRPEGPPSQLHASGSQSSPPSDDAEAPRPATWAWGVATVVVLLGASVGMAYALSGDDPDPSPHPTAYSGDLGLRLRLLAAAR
jgi:tetratricopeptide (TPR) repeat protein